MASVYSLKPRFQDLLRPLARHFVSKGATANEVTLFAGALSVAAGAFLSWQRTPRGYFLILPVALFARMGLNALDGLMAREFQQQTRLGAYLNELSDVVSDAFMILPFARVPGIDPWWIGVMIILATISEMTGILGVVIGASRRYDGPMGKSDRAVVFGALANWLGLEKAIPPQVMLIPGAISILMALTICNRVRGGLAEADSL
ncbi:MAG TPA: CDP-alcohol phosphatidyltransferase family protein [Bryobacteraceae bacterium]|nr:CDP-alcohol phosphatidyltransferase family protein [Bryobacteraceae bacterium]